MGKIISLAGRKYSGKSELANVCVKLGFKLLPMAGPLKELVSHLVGFDINQNQETKERIINMKLTEEQQKYLSSETNINLEIIKKLTDDLVIKDVRQALQFIGTDVIRAYNPNWHVNKVKSMIDSKYNYVCDDMRFKNEMEMFKELGAECWFIVRPYIDNISNHISETSLRWQDFGNKIIINNIPLNILKKQFEDYVSHVIFNNELTYPIIGCNTYSEIREKICSNKDYALFPFSLSKHEKINDSMIRMLRSFLLIPLDYFTYEDEEEKFETDFPYKDNSTLKIEHNEFLSVKIKNKRKVISTNALAIENAKMFF
jgi:hypothetical protein